MRSMTLNFQVPSRICRAALQVLLKQLKSVYLSPSFDKVNFDPLYLLALASLVSKTTFAWDEINVERLPSKHRSLAAELRNLVCERL